MTEFVEKRAIKLGEYIIQNKATVRSTAKKFAISKSTVHKDVSFRLREIDYILYKRVKKILDFNKSERHIRGGMATKIKYLQKSKITALNSNITMLRSDDKSENM